MTWRPAVEIATMIREGSGADLVATIREARRALVFISVPWSCPERNARQVFHAAVARLDDVFAELGIRFFHLNVDEDLASQHWLSSIGSVEFASAGAGSLLWLEAGQVLSSEITANSLGMEGVVSRSTSLWRGRAESGTAEDRSDDPTVGG
jgi:hypothetical protein